MKNQSIDIDYAYENSDKPQSTDRADITDTHTPVFSEAASDDTIGAKSLQAF